MQKLKRESGSTLIVSLLFLVVTTLIATGVWRVAMQQESMTGSERDYQIAFEAAEAALRDAETDYFHLCALSDANGSVAVCNRRTNEIDGLSGFGSTATSEIPAPGSCSADGLCLGNYSMHGTVKLYDAMPSIDVLEGRPSPDGGQRVTFGTYTRTPGSTTEKIPLVAQQPSYVIEAIQVGGNDGRNVPVMYRITAIGYGRRADTRVILQSYIDPN